MFFKITNLMNQLFSNFNSMYDKSYRLILLLLSDTESNYAAIARVLKGHIQI
jgi:hypothetical protein